MGFKAKSKFNEYMKETFICDGFFYDGNKYIKIVPNVAIIVIKYRTLRNIGLNVCVDVLPFCDVINIDKINTQKEIIFYKNYNDGYGQYEFIRLTTEEQLNVSLKILNNMSGDLNYISDVDSLYRLHVRMGIPEFLYVLYLECLQMQNFELALYHLGEYLKRERSALEHWASIERKTKEELHQPTYRYPHHLREGELRIYQDKVKNIRDNIDSALTKITLIDNHDYKLVMEEVNNNIHANNKLCISEFHRYLSVDDIKLMSNFD